MLRRRYNISTGPYEAVGNDQKQGSSDGFDKWSQF